MKHRMTLTDEERNLVELHRNEQEEKWKPKLADEFTVTEKLECFDRLHHMAFKNYHLLTDEGREGDYVEHYMYEAVMELLGDDVWGAVDELTGNVIKC